MSEWAIALWCCCVVHCSFLFLCSAVVVYGSYIHSVCASMCAIVCASDCAIASAISYGTMCTTVCFVKCTAIVATENACCTRCCCDHLLLIPVMPSHNMSYREE